MNNFKLVYGEYLEQFKIMLVRRYNWSVSAANEFNSIEVQNSYNNGLSVEQAYFKMFDKKLDLPPIFDGNTCNETTREYETLPGGAVRFL